MRFRIGRRRHPAVVLARRHRRLFVGQRDRGRGGGRSRSRGGRAAPGRLLHASAWQRRDRHVNVILVELAREVREHRTEVLALGRHACGLGQVDDLIGFVVADLVGDVEHASGNACALPAAELLACRCVGARSLAVRELDDDLEAFLREEATDATLADAIGLDDVRVGAALTPHPLEERFELSDPQTAAGWPRFTTPIVSSSSCWPSSV